MTPKTWFTAGDLVRLKLPGVPAAENKIRAYARRHDWYGRMQVGGEPAARPRQGRGGGWEFHWSVLPLDAQQALMRRGLILPEVAAEFGPAQAPRDAIERHRVEELATAWRDATQARRDEAAQRVRVLQEVDEAAIGGGQGVHHAVCAVARQHKVHPNTIYGWRRRVEHLDRSQWPAALLPIATAPPLWVEAECHPAAWNLLKSDYLRAEQPSFNACYRRLELAAERHGWAIPSARTLRRLLHKTVSKATMVLAREGPDALKRLYPAQQRDKSNLHALEWICADGHRADVMCRWPDGTVGRPMIVAFQDVYSDKLLAWRVAKTENAETVRLCLKDVFEQYGIPYHALLDNGRGFASKWITGGTPTRYRFKVDPGDPEGILTFLGVEVHWTTPYSGQSKPIERAFRDVADDVARHPALAGAYTGNRPENKPHNYGSEAVPIETFETWLAYLIGQHNAREGRDTPNARGRSFDQTFLESYRNAVIRKASSMHIELALLRGDGLTARKPDGAIHLMGNRYWAPFLSDWIGRRMQVRFDPGDLHRPLVVMTPDGRLLGRADCIAATGFADEAAAKAHAQARRRWMRAQRELMEATRAYSAAEVAALLPDPTAGVPLWGAPAPAVPDPKVVALVTRRPAAEPLFEPRPGDLTPAQAEALLGAGLAILRRERQREVVFHGVS